MTWSLEIMRPRATLYERGCRVRPCGSKVVCILEVQVAHVGSSYVECAHGVGSDHVKMIGLDMMSSAMWNTCKFLKFEIG